MKPAVLLRTLVASGSLALGLFALASQSLRADAVSDARTALVAGDFTAAKALLDPVLSAQPTNADAAFLRALSRVGLAAESRVPAFATKLGATTARVDIGDDVFDIRFKQIFTYENTPALTLSNGAYHVPTLHQNPAPAISFENRGSTAATVTLAASLGISQDRPLSIGFQLDGGTVGNLLIDYFGPRFWGDDEVLAFDLVNQRISLTIPAGSAATVEFYQAPSGAAFSLVGTRPSTLVVINGKRVENTRPALAAGANASWLLAFLAQADKETLAPLVADLAVPDAAFAMSFAPEETGSAQTLVVAHVDTQLLLAEIKTTQALRRLLDAYNLSLPLNASLFSEEGPATVLRNTALLTPKAASASVNAGRIAARALFKEALQHYANASDGGAWTRGAPPSGGAYLFAVGEEDPVAREAEKVNLETALAQFEAALEGPTPLAELSDSLATDPAIPDEAGLSLAPLFGPAPVNLRGILPAIGENGIVRGSSSKLLASGLLTNLGTAAWEQFLVSSGLADLETAPRQTGPVIQRQPAALVTVAEQEDAVISLTAECYPAPSYQWFKRVGSAYEPIEGAVAPVLRLPAVTRDDAGLYLCKVTNHRLIPPRTEPTPTTLSSTAAKLVVTYPPEIVAAPEPVARYAGKNVTLTVEAAGVPAVRYQWFKGDTAVTPLRGGPSYVFVASAARAGDYHVVVSNERGSVASEPVAVDVQTKPVFITQPVARTVKVGAPVTFTAEAAGNPMPEIKWRKDGKDLPGATGPVLAIESATLANHGVYTAVAYSTVQTGPASTAVASTVSAGARLTVTP